MLSYLGSIGTWYLLDEMLHFFSRLLKQRPDSKFLFITKNKKSDIIAGAKKFGIKLSSLIIQPAERAEVPVLLSLCDVSIFFIKPSYSKKASSPTKQGEIMGMGIPIICNNIGDTGAIIRNNQVGIDLNDFTDSVFDLTVERLPQLLNLKKEKIRRAAFKHYDLKKAVEKYEKIYISILNTHIKTP